MFMFFYTNPSRSARASSSPEGETSAEAILSQDKAPIGTPEEVANEGLLTIFMKSGRSAVRPRP